MVDEEEASMKYRFTESEAPLGRDLYVLETGKWRTERPCVDAEACVLCGICALYCPTGVIDVGDDVVSIDLQFCKGCMICVRECPREAIEPVPEEGSGA